MLVDAIGPSLGRLIVHDTRTHGFTGRPGYDKMRCLRIPHGSTKGIAIYYLQTAEHFWWT
jgi:hypothetical protein